MAKSLLSALESETAVANSILYFCSLKLLFTRLSWWKRSTPPDGAVFWESFPPLTRRAFKNEAFCTGIKSDADKMRNRIRQIKTDQTDQIHICPASLTAGKDIEKKKKVNVQLMQLH